MLLEGIAYPHLSVDGVAGVETRVGYARGLFFPATVSPVAVVVPMNLCVRLLAF
jgi:hypothetical protein